MELAKLCTVRRALHKNRLHGYPSMQAIFVETGNRTYPMRIRESIWISAKSSKITTHLFGKTFCIQMKVKLRFSAQTEFLKYGGQTMKPSKKNVLQTLLNVVEAQLWFRAVCWRQVLEIWFLLTQL